MHRERDSSILKVDDLWFLKARPSIQWRDKGCGLSKIDDRAFNTTPVLRLSKTGRTVGRTNSRLEEP